MAAAIKRRKGMAFLPLAAILCTKVCAEDSWFKTWGGGRKDVNGPASSAIFLG